MLRPADDPLKEALAEGREEAFAALYDRFTPSLFRVAVTLSAGRRPPGLPTMPLCCDG